MGNCLMRHDNGLTGKEKDDGEAEIPVKLKGEESEGESKVVRIKLLVTKEELRQILSDKKGNDSIQHLVHVLKRSGSNISRTHEEEEVEIGDESWKPTLESIPENH